jgi:hypothetical protein
MNLSILFVSCLVSISAFADVIPSRPDPSSDSRMRFRWKSNPNFIKSSRGCPTANVCFGIYEKVLPGFQGEVVVGSGMAGCNSIGNRCPSAKQCVEDEAMVYDLDPEVLSKSVDSGAPKSNSDSKLGI